MNLARVLAMTLTAASAATVVLEAHTPITTKYRFDTDVRPVLERRCVRCHSPGGPTPMPLRTYKETRPWVESIKEQLLARAMPPLFVEHGSVRVENGTPLTARELDILVDWASGGAPETRTGAEAADGPVSEAPAVPLGTSDHQESTSGLEASVQPRSGWTVFDFRDFLGPENEDASELRISHRARIAGETYLTGWSLEDDPRWLHGATLWIEPTPGVERRHATTRFLGSWVAGDTPVAFPADAALQLEAGSTIRVSAYYKRSWLLRSKKLAPETRLALRLVERAPTRRVISAAVPLEADDSLPPVDGVAFAYFPVAPRPGALLVETKGSSRSLLELFQVSQQWPIMYRFAASQRPRGRLVWRPEGEPARETSGGHALYLTDR